MIGRVLTLHCGGASIEPDDDSTGRTVVMYEWAVRERRSGEEVARILTYMAGAEAERIVLGAEPTGDTHDKAQIRVMAELLSPGADWEKLEPRLRKMMQMLVRRHQVRITRTSRVLLILRTLSARQLDTLARMPNYRPGANGCGMSGADQHG